MGWFDALKALFEFSQNRRRARQVMAQFRSEVHEIREQLRVDTRKAFAAWGQNQQFNDYRRYPHAIYQQSNLEHLNNQALSGEVVAFYTALQQAEDLGQQLRGEEFNRMKLADYLDSSAKCFASSIDLEARLGSTATQVREDHDWANTIQIYIAGNRTRDNLIR